ncbi:SCA7-domain-containing protein [Meredithblackwellia eburnea MCA 4105]
MQLKQVGSNKKSLQNNSTDRWKQIKDSLDSSDHPSPDNKPSTPQSPPVSLLDAKDMHTFGSTPLDSNQSGQAVIRCPDCLKPVLENALAAHAVNCKKIKEKKLSADAKSANLKRGLSEMSDAAPSKKPKQSLIITLGDKTGSGAAGGDEAGAAPPKPKKKKDKDGNKISGSSSSAPGASGSGDKNKTRPEKVDVDRHCGVINDKGFPCSRSLTCKSHSMGAKRSVPHRSQPYDILLHEWQKAHKPETFKNSKPVQPRVGPGSEAYAAASAAGGEGGGKKKKKNKDRASGEGREGGSGTGEKRDRRTRDKGKGLLIVGEYEDSDNPDEEGVIDSEDEVDSVLKGLARVPRGRPLALSSGSGGGWGSFTSPFLGGTGGGSPLGGWGGAPSFFTARNSKLARLREVIGGVFGTPNTNSVSVGPGVVNGTVNGANGLGISQSGMLAGR